MIQPEQLLSVLKLTGVICAGLAVITTVIASVLAISHPPKKLKQILAELPPPKPKPKKEKPPKEPKPKKEKPSKEPKPAYAEKPVKAEQAKAKKSSKEKKRHKQKAVPVVATVTERVVPTVAVAKLPEAAAELDSLFTYPVKPEVSQGWQGIGCAATQPERSDHADTDSPI